jgi:hypothetical protein
MQTTELHAQSSWTLKQRPILLLSPWQEGIQSMGAVGPLFHSQTNQMFLILQRNDLTHTCFLLSPAAIWMQMCVTNCVTCINMMKVDSEGTRNRTHWKKLSASSTTRSEASHDLSSFWYFLKSVFILGNSVLRVLQQMSQFHKQMIQQQYLKLSHDILFHIVLNSYVVINLIFGDCTVAVQSEIWPIYTPSNTCVIGSNPTRSMDACVFIQFLCCPVCR